MLTTVIQTNESQVRPLSGINTDTPSHSSKDDWIRHYSERILKSWHQWESPLGVASAYARHIAAQLSFAFEEPLKREFVEATY